MMDLSVLLPLKQEWTSLQTLGCWASIVALLISLYTAIRVRKVRQYVERDRELLEIASLPEVHDYLQQLGEYVRVSQFLPEQLRQRDDALEKITVSARSIASYYRAAFQVNLASRRALLSAAKDHKKNRRIGQAILSYQRVLENHKRYGGLNRGTCASACAVSRSVISLPGKARRQRASDAKLKRRGWRTVSRSPG
jgi:hypothetical protein